MICTYEDIEEVMHGMDDYGLRLALYGLCANPWKLPREFEGSSPILCYRGNFGELFRNLAQFREGDDRIQLNSPAIFEFQFEF